MCFAFTDGNKEVHYQQSPVDIAGKRLETTTMLQLGSADLGMAPGGVPINARHDHRLLLRIMAQHYLQRLAREEREREEDAQLQRVEADQRKRESRRNERERAGGGKKKRSGGTEHKGNAPGDGYAATTTLTSFEQAVEAAAVREQERGQRTVRGMFERRLLYWACKFNMHDVADNLLEQGVPPYVRVNSTVSRAETALHAAAHGGDADMVAMILDAVGLSLYCPCTNPSAVLGPEPAGRPAGWVGVPECPTAQRVGVAVPRSPQAWT